MSGNVAVNDAGDVLVLGAEGQWAPAQRARNPETGAELYNNGTSWQPLPRAADPNVRAGRQANSGVMGYVDSLVRQGAQGATFGGADEISAGLNTGAGLWGNYGEALAAERGRDEAFRADHPIAAGVANFAGSLLGPGRAVGMMAPAGAGAGLASRLLRSAPGRGSLAGATGGAAAGAGEGEGLEGRATGALTGGAVGGALGGVLGGGVSVGSGLAGRLLHGLGLRNADTAADRQVLRALERDSRPVAGLSVPEGLTLADVGGRNTVGLAGAAANSPGVAMETADALVQARRSARPERIAGAVDESLGGGGGTRVADEVQALQARRSAEAAPLYEAARAAQAPDTPELQAIMNLPIVQSAMRENLDLQSMAARGGHFEPSQMQMLDAAKRGLDERIGATLDPLTRRAIPGRGAENIALSEVRDSLVRQMDAVPEYAQARAAWAGPTQSMEAMGQGKAAYRMNPDQVAQIAARLSPGDLDFFRLGVGRAITDAASHPRTGPSVASTLLEDRNMQRRLEAAIPDPAQRQVFADAMKREVDMAAVDHTISPRAGAQTARVGAIQDDMQNDAPGGLAGALLSGTNLGGAIRQGVNSVYRRAQGMTPATADSLASRLMSADSAQNAETVRRLVARSNTDRMTEQQRASLAAQLLRGLGTTTSLELNDR